ncbi:PP2C family protein-serine/threonine phosphatase [Actinoallomurus rhizosphaericola]|uniref:PP2C family protein-serine/threonine phosphatase n=1 Tax=Actinoallomurus rhizosphaericola TaxID=2952536 RepID=UPI002093598C|nr:PP2C family protein-serine/threonine phosphatase [Actinoallomurus rhizosphaericola]MCO5999433.1 serine/threonine-protein phosphatase [Actinoallomurus rhizosphaericola]
MLALVALADFWASPDIIFRPMLVLGPAFASLWCGIRRTALVGLTALALSAALSYHHHTLGRRHNTLTLLAMAGVAAASVAASADRKKRERILADVRSVAEVAQRVLLRPVPRRVGSIHVAVGYTSATAEASIGGDLYEVTPTPYGVRVIVGDVQGKGLEAVETAADVLGAFREAAYDEPDLTGVATRIEAALRRRLDAEPTGRPVQEGSGRPPAAGSGRTATGSGRAGAAGSGRTAAEGAGEKFVTAVLAEFGEAEIVTLLNYGHPSPFVLRGGGEGGFAEPDDVAPPFGLSDLGAAAPRPYRIKFAPADQMLLYTDGVVEARDGEGRFYPLAERAHLLQAADPEQALGDLRADVLRHVGGRIADDAAMLLIRRR